MKVRVLRHTRQSVVHLQLRDTTHDQPACRVITSIYPGYWCWDDWIDVGQLRMIEKSLCKNCVKKLVRWLGVGPRQIR